MTMTMTKTKTCMAQRDQDLHPFPFQSSCFVPTPIISEKAEEEQVFVMLPYWLNYWKECCLWPWLRLLRGLLGHISDYPDLGAWKSNRNKYLENILSISRIFSNLPPFHIDHSARLNILKLRTMEIGRNHRIVDLFQMEFIYKVKPVEITWSTKGWRPAVPSSKSWFPSAITV